MSETIKTGLNPEKLALVEKRAEDIRELVFQAQALADVAAASLKSETPPNEWSTHKALQMVVGLLDTVATRLGPGAMTGQ